MNFGFIRTAPCTNVAPPPDGRCQDPAFALANPDICPAVPHLLIKPSFALRCALSSVQFRAFLVTAGVESDVTADATFSTSNPDVALVGAGSGSATGLSQGMATIAASYNTYSATAELSVIGSAGDCCSQQHVSMMVLIDTSRSMSQKFTGLYSTRLDYAKAAATRFISEVNETKDSVGLMSFDLTGANVLSSLSANKGAVEALVPSVAQTQQKTEFFNAITAAIAQVALSSSDIKVLLIISDGEDTSDGAGSGYSDGASPVVLTSNFKDQGGIVICLGARASGSGFAFLSELATGGFFINAYSGNEAESLNFLSGLKGYICAGNCTPEGDEIVGMPMLDYSAFTNWNLIGGKVDLIGNGLFDFLPGNGLYLDLVGSTSASPGQLVLKNPIAITAGNDYRLSLELGGNQRLDATPYSVTARVYYKVGAVETDVLKQVVTINDYRQNFHEYAFTFKALVDGEVYISIQQTAVPTGSGLPALAPYFGLLLNRVKFDDSTEIVSLLRENWEAENLKYIPPKCGVATTWYNGQYATGYNCYGAGCLDSPPGNQLPDPSPLPDIEGGYNPPHEYSSTRQACVSCAVGQYNLSVDPAASATAPTITLAAATVINQYQFSGTDPAITNYSTTPYKVTLEGSNDGTTWTALDTRYDQIIVGGTVTHAGTLSAFFNNVLAFSRYRLVTSPALPVGFLTSYFRLFSVPSAQSCNTASATSEASQADADTKAYNAALEVAQAALNCVPVYTASEQYTATCPAGAFGASITKNATGTSMLSLQDAQAQARASAKEAAEFELVCTGSNNNERITLNDVSAGTPYPSVKFVSGFPVGQVVSGVVCSIRGLTHPSLGDMQILLRAPDGKMVVLMEFGSPGVNMTNVAVAGVNLIISDAGIVFTTGVAPVTGGTYKPYGFAPINMGNQFPAPYPGPATPATTMAHFVGSNPNGSWSLWAIDVLAGGVGTIDSWDLTITAA